MGTAKKIKWSFTEVKAGDLIQNPDNPKKRDEAGMRRLRKLTEKYGIVFSGIVNKDMMIIDGHSRNELSEPNEKVWVFMPDRLLKPDEYKEMNALYDMARAGTIDMQILEKQFTEEFFDEWEIEPGRKTVAVDDNYDMPEKVDTEVKAGDLFEIGPHRIMCGDCRNAKYMSKLMNGQLCDLVETDPPYNVDYKGSDSLGGMQINNDNMPDAEFYKFLLDAFMSIEAHTKPGGPWYIWHADSEGANFRNAMLAAGIMIKQCLVWVKNSLVMGRQDYQWKHEPCLYGWKPGAAHYFIDDRSNTTVIEDQVDYRKLTKPELLALVKELTADKQTTSVIHADKPTKNDLHPTMKPILLLAPLIENSSRKGEIVGDFFSGSESTMVTCHQLGRRCYAMDNDPKFVHVTVDRMLKLDPDLKIKKNGKPWKFK